MHAEVNFAIFESRLDRITTELDNLMDKGKALEESKPVYEPAGAPL